MTDNPTTFVGSHEKSRAGFGTNGDANASSVLPGEAQPALVEPTVAPPTASVPGLSENDKLNARVSGSAVPTHSHMLGHVPNSGSPSGKVQSNNRPVSQPAPSGTFKRD